MTTRLGDDMTAETVVERALRGVLRDHGWRVVDDAARLRAMLSDVLGADAPEHRGLVDALVLAAEHGVPRELDDSETKLEELTTRLESWGLSQDRARWAVAAWASVAPGGTDPAPVTMPPAPPAPELGATALPPAYGLTALPPAPAGWGEPTPPVPSTPAATGEARWWQRRAVVASVVAGALVLTGGVVAALAHGRGHDAPAAGSGPRPSAASSLSPVSGVVLVTDRASSPKPLAHPVGMAARDVGVGLAALSDVSEVRVGGQTFGPPPGGRLISFNLDHWACQTKSSCGPGGKVHVDVDGRYRSLAGKGPYVVAVTAGTSNADLVLKADGVTQRISLLTGKAAPGNIAVLARPHHTMKLNVRFKLSRTTSIPIYYIDGHQATYHHTLDVSIDGAELDYFVNGKTPHDTDHAFLFVDYTYGYDEDPDVAKNRYVLDNAEVTFVARDGRRYHAKDLDAREGYAYQVFEVPASLKGGRVVFGGPQRIPEVATNGTHFTSQVAPRVVRLSF